MIDLFEEQAMAQIHDIAGKIKSIDNKELRERLVGVMRGYLDEMSHPDEPTPEVMQRSSQKSSPPVVAPVAHAPAESHPKAIPEK